MRRSFVTLAVLALLAAGCGSGGSTSETAGSEPERDKAPLAKAVSIDSAVDVSLADAKFVPVEKPVPVEVGDVVRTDESGFAEITYRDGSLSRLDVNSELTVVALSDGVDGSSVRTEMGVGRTWHRVEKLSGDDEFVVKTSVATATVRGTAFAIDCPDEATCTFTVFEGTIEIELTGGKTFKLEAPSAVTVTSDDAGAPAAVDPLDVLNADKWLTRNANLDVEAGFGGPKTFPVDNGKKAGTLSEGLWRFDFQDPRVNFGTGRMASATVTKAGDRIRVVGSTDTTATFGPNIRGDIPIRCSGTHMCIAQQTGFLFSGSRITVVNPATEAPIRGGAGTCGAPTVPDLGVVQVHGANSFTYLDGTAQEVGFAGSGSCVQVVWTVVATKL